jgi:mRNA-degrading endonuclease RelE of RelBE toxin-antitoxin system
LPAGWLGNARKLKGVGNEYRLRVGRWRIRFTADKATKTFTILAVVQRKEAYRK